MTACSIGVAMCTCNGEAYLREQLDSIAAQSRLPDHVVISDDASADTTWPLLEAWQAEMAGRFRVTLLRNDPRLGIVRNFEAATRALATDLIFLCDQDDVWLPIKLAAVGAELEADAAVDLVFTDAELIDAAGAPLGLTLFDSLRLGQAEIAQVESTDAFVPLSRRNVVTGATAAFRRQALELAYPFSPYWLHDEWLALMTAAGAGKLRCLRTPTIRYRQHGRNAIGAQRQTLLTQTRRIWWLLNGTRSSGYAENFSARCAVLADRLIAHGRDARWIAIAEHLRAFAAFRNSLPAASAPRRVLSVVGHAAQYRRFTVGLEEFARDLANR